MGIRGEKAKTDRKFIWGPEIYWQHLARGFKSSPDFWDFIFFRKIPVKFFFST